ncbi:MAG: carboxypeptidase regulatory-like domain-containing protein [Phycisphaerae bacterium]|nr:carboxypeptidase regulatory-like domain-containing protein [Phycisphaerae bacterium]
MPSVGLQPSTEMAEHEAVPTPGPAEPVPTVLPSAIAITWPTIALLIWLAVVVAMVLLLIQRLLFVRGLIAQSSDADSELSAILRRCCKWMHLKKHVRLRLSPTPTSPAVCGLLHPVILLPDGFAGQLDNHHLRAVLLHELAHIKRRDLWANLVQTILQIVYFYNPLLWLANAVIRRVREQAVDEMVLVAMGENHEEYPDTLLAVARLSLARPALSLRLIGVVESKKALTQRIKHIISRPLPKTAKLGLLGLATVLIIAALLIPMATAREKIPVLGEGDEPIADIVDTSDLAGDESSPERVVMVDPKLMWNSSGWARGWGPHSWAVAMDVSGDSPRFSVIEPEHCHVWTYYFTAPVDPNRYPIIVLTYRARNAPSDRNYVIWLDDTRGPNSGGVVPFYCSSLRADGKIYRLERDLRELGPKGHITGMALGVYSGKQTPGEFELIGLRFEAPGDAEKREAIPEDKPVSIRVVDIDGGPVEGATVVVDPERINWSRSSTTGKDGRATLIPLVNVSGRHMLQISKPGMATVVAGDRRSSEPLPEQVTLVPSVSYGATVLNEDDQPVKGVAVRISVRAERKPGIRSLRTINVLTDARGRWRTPPLPANLEGLNMRLAHPDYVSYVVYGSTTIPPIGKLRDQTGVMVIKRGVQISGTVMDAEGNPVAGARVKQGRDRWGLEYSQTTTDEQGRFKFTNAKPGEMILTVQKEGFAPQMARPQARRDMDPLRLVLEKGQTILGRVVDERGESVAGARVLVIFWNQAATIRFDVRTDLDGRFSWQDAPSNEVFFRIAKEGYVSSSVNLAPSKQEQIITLTRPLSLRLLQSLRSMGSFVVGVARPNPEN